MPALSRKELDAKKQEVNNLYAKLSEVGSSLKEEKKIYQRLRADVAAKIEQLTKCESTIVSEQETYNWRKSEYISRADAAKEEGTRRLDELGHLSDEIDIELSDHDLLEMENERLHRRLKVLSAEHHKLTAEHREELEIRKQACFDKRASMELIFRKTIKEVDHEYMLRANEKMDQEAEWARAENIRLRREAGKRQEDCANLVEQQKSSYEELVRAKVLLNVIEATTSSQEVSSMAAEEYMEELLREMQRMEATKSNLELDIQVLNQKLDRKIQLEKEYRQLQKHLESAKLVTAEMKSKVVKECDQALKKGISIVERENAKKAKQLAKSFQDAIGGKDDDSADPNAPQHQQSASENSTTVNSSNVSVADSFAAENQLGDEDDMSVSNGKAKPEIDPEMMWKSSRSDCHKATVVRQQVRKNRERQARMLMME
jgi:hypothetical protein